MEFYNFDTLTPRPDEPGNKWEYIDLPFFNFTSRGGSFISGPNGGFVNANPYNNTYGQSILGSQLNSLKFLLENSELVPVPASGQLDVQWKVAVENFKINESPFPAEMVNKNDVRLGSGVLFLHDLDNDLYFDWLITNDRIYARYARDTLARAATPGYASFVFIVPVAERRPCDMNMLRVKLDSVNKSAHWFVGGHEVFKVTQVGKFLKDRNFMTQDLGGVQTLAFPTSVRISFGAVTLLDNYPTCKRACDCNFPMIRTALVNQGTAASPKQYDPLLGPPVPATYYDNQSLASNRLWGQGSIMNLKELAVYETLPCQ